MILCFPQLIQSAQGYYLCKNNLLIQCQSLDWITFTSLVVNSFGYFWQFCLSKALCNSVIDRTFVPLSLQTLSQLSTLGHFLEPESLTLCTACSSPQARLLLKGLISLLLAMFPFSVKTYLKSEKYTGMCLLLNLCDVDLRCSKEIVDILANN